MKLLNKLINNKKLIINADDFGLNDEASLGIVEALNLDLINSISVSVTNHVCLSRYWKKLRRHNAFIGLHINLSEGRPLSNSKRLGALINEMGLFLPAHTLLAREMLLDTQTISNEIMAQINYFKNMIGILPTHLDCHQHFLYLSTKGFQALVNISQKINIPIRSPEPFLNTDTFSHFIFRVEKKYKIKLTINHVDRAKMLYFIFNKYNPQTRSKKIIIDANFYDREQSNLLKRIEAFSNNSVEIICHPRFFQGKLKC